MTDDLSNQVMAQQAQMRQSANTSDFFAELERIEAAGPTPAPEAAPEAAEDEGRSVVGDIALGLVETPRQVLGGVRDAVQETLDFTHQFGAILDESVPLGRLNIDLDPDTSFFESGTPEEQPINLPEVAEADTVTGGMVRGVSQFITGFLGANKALAPIRAVGGTARLGRAALAGAMADFTVFDEHEDRLSDLVQEFPALQNPVTEYLAADPTDSFAEGRFKNALEGLGLGVAVDGFVAAVRAMRSARAARSAATSAGIPEQPRGVTQQEVLAPIGDTDAPLIGDRPASVPARAAEAPVNPDAVPSPLDEVLRADDSLGVPDEVAARGLSQPVYPLQEGTGTDEVFVNFARIDAPDDVKNAIGQMADAMAPQIDEARRGVQSFEETARLADDLGMDVEDLLARNDGQPFNAETALAARRLWAQSGERLAEVAQLAADNPSEANLVAFRRMMAVHNAVQTQVIAARTETARALSAWRIPAGGNVETARAIETLLEQSGGAGVTRELAQRIAAVGNDPRALGEVVKRTLYQRTRDAIIEGWVMGLLSGPKTHMVNAMSNTSVILQQMQERAVAARIAQVLGDDAGVQLGEATAQMAGALSAQRDALRLAWRALVTEETGASLGKIDLPRRAAISSEGLQIASDTWIGRGVDFLGAAVRIPGRLLGASDEYFKTVGYRMEVHAQAVRQAAREVDAGTVPADGMKARVAELVENPPENLRLEAVDQALYQTFTNPPGRFGQMLSRAVNEFPLLRWILPFVRTPANIAHYTFVRTPLAPLFQTVRADIAAGGARRDLALSRMASGTFVMLGAMDFAMDGSITGAGPTDQGEKQALLRTGWKPYSIRVGERFFAYNRLDPIGMTLGLGADFAEFTVNSEWGEEDLDAADEMAAAIIGSIGGNLTSKTYLRGISEFFEFMANPQMFGEGYVRRFAGSVVPAGAAEIARTQDPYLRSADDLMSAIKRRTPGLSDELPPVRDLWGRPVDFRSGLGTTYDMVSPIYASSHDPEPIDEEFLRLEYFPRKPPYRTSFNGVSVNLRDFPEAYSRYIELTGNALKHPTFGLGAMDLLNAVVTGNHTLSGRYQLRTDGPEGGKSMMLRDLLLSYRDLAKQQVLQEFPALRLQVEQGMLEQRRRQTGQ